MSKTLQQLSDYIGTEPEIRSLINETVKYLQAEWPPEGSTVQTVYSRKTILADAQIKASPSNYIELVPAPGAGKILLFHQACLVFKFDAAGYTNAHTDHYLMLAYGDWDVDASSATKLFTNGLDTRGAFLIPGVHSDDVFASTTNIFSDSSTTSVFMNAPLKLIADNSSNGDFTGGNAANTLEITVFYSIVDL